MSLTNNKDEIRINVRVENIGKFSGKEVVQVYVSPSQEIEDKPYQVLVAFKKTKDIDPGNSCDIKIKFKLREVARYDTITAQYILDKGKYFIRVGNSSRNTLIYGYVELDENIIIEQLKNIVDNPGFEDYIPDANFIKNLEI